MAHTANERSTSATWSQGAGVPSENFETIEANAAGAVNRAASKSGTMNYPIFYGGSNSTTTVGVYYDANGEALLLNTVSYIVLPIVGLPDAHTLTSVTLKLHPASGHTGTPASLPYARVQVVSTAGVRENLGSASVSFVSTAAYEAGFDLAVTGIAHTIDLERNRYQIWLNVEHDSNSENGCRLESMKVGCTVDTSSGGTDLAHWLKS